MGYIFETEIETIINTVRARTIGEAESITLRKVSASDVHPAIKAYFKAEVERMLQEERAKEVRSKKLPYGMPEVARLQRQIDLLLVNNYQFDQHEFESLLDHAVHFQFNFLCRPQWTLLSFIFESQRRRPAAEIVRKLKYCVDFTYFSEILKRYVEDHGLAELTYEEFQSLLEKIDREIVARHSSTELALLCRPMLTFIDAGRPLPRDPAADASIPINAAVVFFEDKKLTEIREYLERERDTKSVVDVTLPHLAAMIGAAQAEAIGAEGRAWAEIPEPAIEVQMIPTAVADKPVAPQEGRAEPAHGLQPARVVTPLETLSAPEKPRKGNKEGRNEETATETTKLLSHSLLEDTHSLFTKTEQRKFVKAVFHKDEVEFRNALDALNKIQTWEEASLFLDELFVAHNVDPFSKEAVGFTDKVYARFHPFDRP